MYLNIADFREVINSHDQFGNFTAWRNTIAQHAASLAGFFKTFPGTQNIAEADVRAVFAAGAQFRGNAQQVFQPWAGWWTGQWSNRVNQYHIWDDTVLDGSQFIQPVTQSTVDFVDSAALRRSPRPEVNLAINVCSGARGITGWVSKPDGELPHVGYLLNPVTLIWITQISGRFFMFFEWVDTRASQYGIHGRPFAITGNQFQGTREQHYGVYDRFDPARRRTQYAPQPR